MSLLAQTHADLKTAIYNLLVAEAAMRDVAITDYSALLEKADTMRAMVDQQIDEEFAALAN